jgi:FtsP/CotA-like multicopper oxidase with cupredoxin domain
LAQRTAQATGSRRRLLVACLASLAVLVPLGWFWQASLLPGSYSVMDMGYMDYGGGPRASGATAGMDMDGGDGTMRMAAAPRRSVTDLVADPDRPADVRVHLVARQGLVRLASGRTVEGYTVNGRSPGPLITAREGQLVEVHLSNASVADGITLHWHGVDVPNSADGVAGVTQDAVGPGEEHTYRFVADDPGTYWYHSHQVSHEQVLRGLFGPLVVLPREPDPDVLDVPAVVHLYSSVRTVNGEEGDVPVRAEPGRRVRVRVVNTDNGPMEVWAAGAPYRLVAVDGRDLHEPGPVRGRSVTVTAGGRADLEVVMPRDGSGVRVQLGSSTALVLGDGGTDVPASRQPHQTLDLLHYGTPAAVGFDPEQADRRFVYSIGRRPGFLDGRPGLWWTINGHLFPDIPMFVVREGDVVRMHLENHSGDVHPMHLHGHHALVLARNGERATGSPWWVDSLNVQDGESYDIAFVADNPGIWMDHCHNLPHATQGLVAHLMYEGVTEPFRVGGDSDNQPE